MRIRNPLAVSVLAALVASAIGAGGAGATPGPCATGQVVKTPSWRPSPGDRPASETMYTRAQVKAEHPTSGEEMLSGSMTTGMAGMTMPSGERHLEVHICTAGGAVYTKGHPTISIVDTSAKALAVMMVPVATMEGIGEGSSDFHYGNNVALTAGHHLRVSVFMNGRKAVFHTIVPKST